MRSQKEYRQRRQSKTKKPLTPVTIDEMSEALIYYVNEQQKEFQKDMKAHHIALLREKKRNIFQMLLYSLILQLFLHQSGNHI